METLTHQSSLTTETVASFHIHHLRFLDAEGQLTQPLPPFADPHTLLKLYEWMVLVRTFDTKAVNLQRTGQLGTFPSSLGQEALTVGMGYALLPTDVYGTCYRDQGVLIQRNVKMSEILAYWGGDERGNCYAHNKTDLPTSIPVASHLHHATGMAYALQYRNEHRAVLTLVGDGGTSQGDFYEAINLAGVWKLPIVFVINNNQWAISVSRHRQTRAHTLAQKAIAAGFEGIQVDGNDVIAVHETVACALDRARNGQGPTLIEALTFRLCDHTTADDANRYIPKEEMDAAWENEPIKRLRTYLHEQGYWDKEKEHALIKQCREQIDVAVQEYSNTPKQTLSELFDYLYAELPEPLHDQKEAMITQPPVEGA
ncbi:MAG TPA: pyruvate dehydrogenase (acetyl-transferring) E1 component subunit alpha [Coxiellaceae bacterium]|nr:pyruvate dehydrogenase (acetyl-transferring) E1 component subunit alpha [Coxiellaceae bacterium]